MEPGQDETSDFDRYEPEEWCAKQEFRLLLRRLRGLPAPERAKLQGIFAEALLARTFPTETPRGPLSFVLVGRLAARRAMTLLTKQRSTIAWIDSFLPGSLFWDVGANVGVYTLYAARRGDTRVVSFEPAAVNYFLLAANCEANGLTERVECLCLGLGEGKGLAHLRASQFEAARSFSFREKGSEREPSGRQASLVVSMDQLIEEYGVACPNYVKIDVPGLTEQILAGGARLLQRPELRSLHVEMKDDTPKGQNVIRILGEHGFVIAGQHKHHDTADVTFARTGD
jgi:FkbM family methyltransferase